MVQDGRSKALGDKILRKAYREAGQETDVEVSRVMIAKEAGLYSREAFDTAAQNVEARGLIESRAEDYERFALTEAGLEEARKFYIE